MAQTNRHKERRTLQLRDIISPVCRFSQKMETRLIHLELQGSAINGATLSSIHLNLCALCSGCPAGWKSLFFILILPFYCSIKLCLVVRPWRTSQITAIFPASLPAPLKVSLKGGSAILKTYIRSAQM